MFNDSLGNGRISLMTDRYIYEKPLSEDRAALQMQTLDNHDVMHSYQFTKIEN